MLSKYRRVVAAGAVASSLALLAAGCTEDTADDDTQSTTTAAEVDLSILGEKNPASGDPIQVGFIYSGETAAIDTTPEYEGAKATVEYVNEYMGGIGGRPLELLVCTDLLTPAGATDCGNEMVAAGVPIVLQSQPINPVQITELLEPAAIPYFTAQGFDPSILMSDMAFALGNPFTIVGAPVTAAKAAGATKTAMVYIDLPATATFTAFAKPVFEANDIELISTAIAPGTPDVNPQIQAALSDGAEQFMVVGDSTLCINTLKALKTLGFDGSILVNFQCIGGLAEAVPGGIEGVQVGTTQSGSSDDADVQLYDAIMAHYAPDTQAHGLTAESGYAIVMGFARATHKLDGAAATSADFVAAIKAMDPQPLPLFAEGTFQCNGTAAPLTKAVCASSALIETLNADGTVKSSEQFDVKPFSSIG